MIVAVAGIDGNRVAVALDIADGRTVPFFFVGGIIDALGVFVQFHVVHLFPLF